MLLDKMKKNLPCVFAIGSGIACLVMVLYEVLTMHVPALVRFALALFLLGYVITEYGTKKTK